jgi:UDP-N-acetylglucosamine enolpyruvyl transferase
VRHDQRVPAIQYIVEGGHRLTGTIKPSGNKNAALPIIAAALLTEHPVTLNNVPRIRDTETLVELIRSVGASTINNADQIERGYERIDERLNALGAKITRVPARVNGA